jgi:diketogulonate reductase-like aldo/keto reductase
MLNRWVEEELLDVLLKEGIGCIAFSPLAQGLLSEKYLRGLPESSRAAQGVFFSKTMLSERNLANVRALNEIARQRGQSLAQMAIAWVLRKPAVTSALIGASRWSQIEECLGALASCSKSIVTPWMAISTSGPPRRPSEPSRFVVPDQPRLGISSPLATAGRATKASSARLTCGYSAKPTISAAP